MENKCREIKGASNFEGSMKNKDVGKGEDTGRRIIINFCTIPQNVSNFIL